MRFLRLMPHMIVFYLLIFSWNGPTRTGWACFRLIVKALRRKIPSSLGLGVYFILNSHLLRVGLGLDKTASASTAKKFGGPRGREDGHHHPDGAEQDRRDPAVCCGGVPEPAGCRQASGGSPVRTWDVDGLDPKDGWGERHQARRTGECADETNPWRCVQGRGHRRRVLPGRVLLETWVGVPGRRMLMRSLLPLVGGTSSICLAWTDPRASRPPGGAQEGR